MASPTLHVIATVFNPAGYASRYRLYRDFAARMSKPLVKFHTVELAIGNQPFVVTDSGNPLHVQVRTPQALWYKENLVNVGIRRLPKDWEYVAWIDADIQFARPDWPRETIAQLQDHPIVQMFSVVADLGPKYNPLGTHPGYVYRHRLLDDERLRARRADRTPDWGEPGFAWAARRPELEAVEGLLDWSIVGSGDALMANAVAGIVDRDHSVEMSLPAQKVFGQFRQTCARHFRGNLGHVDGMISHFWHGSRANRGYRSREKILIDNDFDPAADLRRDADGLLHLTGNKPILAQQIAAYFNARNEDAMDIGSGRQSASPALSPQL